MVVAGIGSFSLGLAWYTALFGKIWQSEVGLTEESMKTGSIPLIFGASFVLIFLMDFGLAIILQGHAARNITALSGMVYGLLIGLFFNALSIGINMIYQRKSFALWAIDAGYQVIYLGLTGAILGAWR